MSQLGDKFVDRIKAVQSATPAAADLKDRVKAAAGAVRFNRETLKAGRDGLAAKVEGLLKPRAVDDVPKPSPQSDARSEPKTERRDLGALKARLDDALKRPPDTGSTDIPLTSSASEPVPTDRTVRYPLAEVTSKLKTGLSRLTTRLPATSVPAPVVEPDEPATVRTGAVRTNRTLEALTEARRPIVSLAMLATAFAASGVLHILTTFAIPAINTGSAYDRLRWQLEPNTMRVFPADANGTTPLPFLTADMRYAMCRYDLTNGPVQVSATLPDIGWSLALYTPQGDNFYAVPGVDGRIVTSAFTLNTASDRLLLPMPGVRRSDTDVAQVTSPQREGLLVVRAPNTGPAFQPALQAALQRITCRAAPRR